jgi:hypothetical protein
MARIVVLVTSVNKTVNRHGQSPLPRFGPLIAMESMEVPDWMISAVKEARSARARAQ